MMFGRKHVAVLATAAILALAGCAGTTAPDGDAEGGTLTIGTIVPPATFNAANAQWANESPYLQAVYDTLLRAQPDGTVEPHLATEWAYNEDNTVLTLTLRDDVEFTDGEAFTAEVAAANVLAFRDGTSPNASNLVNVAEAEALDATTLEITLSQPDPALLTYLTQNAGLQASPAAAGTPDVDTTPIGSGPYVLVSDETVVGTSYVFEQNEQYWKPEDQHYDRIVMNVYTDATSLLNAIQGGQINAARLFDNATIEQIEAAGWGIVASELDWSGLLIMDREGTQVPALADPRVRQAINLAFDREALLDALQLGYGSTTTQIFPPSSPSYDDGLDELYPYDPERARELMAAAGYEAGFSMTMPSTNALGPATFTLLQQQLGDIGITVNYEDAQISDYISNVIAAKYPAALFQLQQDPTDWQLSQFQIVAASTFNPFRVADPTVEALVETIQTGSEDEAAAAGAELNAYIVEQAWFAPFYRIQSSYAVDANTTAVAQVGNAYPYLWNITPAE